MIRPVDPDDLPTLPWDRDDALLEAARATDSASMAAYSWDHVAVVIGRGGHQAEEIHRDRVAADAVPLHRRPGGGCAVVLDPGNVIVSLAWPLPGIGGITGAFDAISEWMAAVLDRCGVPGVTREGVSDLVLGDRKIGGSCIWRTRGLVYYSTTLLVDPDLDLVERYLPHPPREPVYRAGRSHRGFMGSLRAAGCREDAARFAAAVERSARQSLGELGNSHQDVP